jgi:hypothetical protein
MTLHKLAPVLCLAPVLLAQSAPEFEVATEAPVYGSENVITVSDAVITTYCLPLPVR